MKIRTGIIGASGYTGVELARILSLHPEVELTVATSRQYAGIPLAEVFPNLRNRVSLVCENPSLEELLDRVDLFFLAVPHKTAMNLVPTLLEAGKKVVDLSADFRIKNQATYEEWYQPHSCPQYLKEAVYGLPELNRDAIRSARLVANPGCYPTSIILGLAPLLTNNIIGPETIIADSKSGTTGAGRTAQTGTLFCEIHDGFRAYKVGRSHRHTPEIEQELSLLAGKDTRITFTPHLLPIARGIFSTVYATMNNTLSTEQLNDIYRKYYKNEKFVRILPDGSLPATQYVRGSNFIDISFRVDSATNRIIVLTTIDNIVKGAAGQAVQNMNVMCGVSEQAGLLHLPTFP